MMGFGSAIFVSSIRWLLCGQSHSAVFEVHVSWTEANIGAFFHAKIDVQQVDTIL